MNKISSILLVSVFSFLFSSVLFAQGKPDALKLYREGSYREAISICEQEIASNPSNLDSHAVLCWSLVANKQYNEAEQRATEARKINQYDIRLMEVLGEAKYYLGNYKGATEQFQKYFSNATESHPRLGSAYYLMGEIYIKQGRYMHADISLSMAVKKDATNDKWWTELGYAREMAKDYVRAAEAYDKALSINPSSINAEKGRTRVNSKLQ